MGLFTTYSADNRRIESETQPTYSKKLITGQWTWLTGLSEVTETQAWEFHRLKQKTYRYVGMTKSAADTCAADMVAAYTRDEVTSMWDNVSRGDETTEGTGEFHDVSGGSRVMASVTVQHIGGCMYDCVINISEDDTKIRIDGVNNPSVLFAVENQRTYNA